MIIFKKIRWKNLLATGNDFIEVDLNSHQNTVIVGENGAGKSTILEALSFVLFNKPFRNITKPQLVNSINKKDCLVEIEFDTNNKSYKVRRGISPGIFEIYQNDTLIDQVASPKEYQMFLEEKILNRTWKSFCQIEVLGSATFVPFMALSTGDRRKIVEDLLDLDIFSVLSSIIKEDMNTTKDAIYNLDSKRMVLDSEISSWKLMQQKLAEKDNFHLADKMSLYNSNKKSIDQLKSEIEKEDKALQNLLEIDEGSLQSKIIKANSIISNFNSKISAANREYNFYDNNQDCPTCHQRITEEFKGEKKKELQSKNEEILNHIETVKEKLKEYNEKEASISKIKKEILNLTMKIQSLESRLSLHEKENANIDAEIEEHKSKTHNEQIEDTFLEEAEAKILHLSDEQHSEMKKQKIQKVALSMLKDNGVKAKIISKYINIINEHINKYLSIMDFFAEFELDEKFKETIKSRYRDNFSYTSFSEGEKMRIDLAVLFTWRKIARMRNTSTSNLLIMDEVLDSSLDADAKDSLLKIILDSEKVNTIVISHNPENMGNVFDRTIHYTKERNFTVTKEAA